jgi:hypothetical protein
MIKQFFITALLFSVSISGFTSNGNKESNYKYLSFGTGYSQFRMIDRKVSPLVYSSVQSPNIFTFQNEKERSIFRVSLNFEYSFISPVEYSERIFSLSQPNHDGVLNESNRSFSKSSLIQDEINAEYLRLISTDESGKFNLFLGAQLKQYFSYSETPVPMFVFSELSLNPSLLLRYRFNNSLEIQTGFSTPLVSLITQMPYANDPTDGVHNHFVSTFLMGTYLTSINRFQRINFSQSIIKKFNNRWAVGLDYNFYWLHYGNVNDINAYDNSVTIKIMISLNSKK